MTTKTYTGVLHIVSCYSCYMDFGIPEDFYDRLKKQRTKGCFICPSCGCRQHFIGESEETKLKRQLANSQEEMNRAREQRQRVVNELETTCKQRNALKGHLGRVKKRAATGTCLCCKRTFQALSTHMLKQHPEYVKKNRTKKG